VPTDVEITDPKISIFVPVAPATAEGVCEICHNATVIGRNGTYYSKCWNCRSLPHGSVRTIVPISLVHTSESQLYASLRDYKSESPYIADSVRAEHQLLLAATVQRFLRIHREHIEQAAGVSWDTIQIVPSTRPGRRKHPLAEVIRMTIFRDELAELLTHTDEPIGHNEPNSAAFAPVGRVHGRNVLIVDDTFTTGARVQSVAGALTSAGATVAAAVPIGRVIGTDRSEKEAFWRAQRAIAFDFDCCCLEA
jgi:pyrimidine operon attenuation protein/uracil phosphoribosyltransferase